MPERVRIKENVYGTVGIRASIARLRGDARVVPESSPQLQLHSYNATVTTPEPLGDTVTPRDTPRISQEEANLNTPQSLDAVYACAARHASCALARRHGLRPALALCECEAASDADGDA